MNLEQFKLSTQAERDAYGKTIPHGITYDKGYVISHKESDGNWYNWYEYTRDDKGNPLTYKNSVGCWREYTRDDKGNELTYKNSDGDWSEYTRDDKGNIVSYKDSDGNDLIYLHYGQYYNLCYNYKNKNYEAGCQSLTYKQCLKFYDENKYDFDDAEKFIEKIKEHHLTLNQNSV